MLHSLDERATDLPTFSIIIPCYNAEATLVRAVDSCFAQTERSAEIILIDDASQDATPDIMKSLAERAPADMPVRTFSMHMNGGPSQARNQGWDMARGRYIAFLDADDCWDDDKLAFTLSALNDTNHNVVLVGHVHRQLDEPRVSPVSLQLNYKSAWQVLLRNIAQTSCVVVQRQLSLRFDTTMSFAEDHDLWFRIARLGHVVYLPHAALTRLGRPQLSSGGLSSQRWNMRRGELYLYIKAARTHLSVLICLPALVSFSLIKHLWSSFRLLNKPTVSR